MSFKVKKILVTGCAGFIGFHLCMKLIKRKYYDVYGLDNLNNYPIGFFCNILTL